jgi:hypothetical protein
MKEEEGDGSNASLTVNCLKREPCDAQFDSKVLRAGFVDILLLNSNAERAGSARLW